jgi:hypothetical protein
MAVDIVAACDASRGSSDTQNLAIILSVVFTLYILLDSVLASWVIVRKARESEAISATNQAAIAAY